MRRSTIRFLEPWIDPHRVSVRGAVIAGDGLDLLRRGLVWDAVWSGGRLVGKVWADDLAAEGELDLLRRAIAGDAFLQDPMRRTLLGEEVSAAERRALPADDQIDLLLAKRCTGGPVHAADFDEVASLVEEDHWALVRLRHVLLHPPGTRFSAPDDTPPLVREPEDVRLSVDRLIQVGDVDLFRIKLSQERARIEALPAASPYELAALAGHLRLFAGDDAAARAMLERIPLVEAYDAWRALFGEAGDARIRAGQAVVLDTIERAFDGVPFPGPNHRSIFQAEAEDSYAACDQSRDHTGRWQDLPDEHLVACQFSLSYFDAEGLQYYAPAILSFVVRGSDPLHCPPGAGYIFGSVTDHLAFWLRDQDRLLHSFTAEQLGAVATFARFQWRVPAEVIAGWEELSRTRAER